MTILIVIDDTKLPSKPPEFNSHSNHFVLCIDQFLGFNIQKGKFEA